MTNKIPGYKLILESSILYGKPIRSEVVKLIKDYSHDKRLSIIFYAPQVVLDEAKKHLLDDYHEERIKYETVTKELSQILGSKFNKLQKSDEEIFAIVDQIFSNQGIKILATPKDINLGNIIQKAIYRKPPFSPDKEKGFKDAIIAETILNYLPELLKDSQVVFLCTDGLLAEYMSRKVKSKNFKTYPSVPDFESALRLNLLKLSDQFISEVTKEAELAFYNPTDKNSLYFRESIPKLLLEKYTSLFANPKIEEDRYYGYSIWNATKPNWVPVASPTYRVSSPVFIGKGSEKEYKWESTVVYSQIYENQPPGVVLSGMGYAHREDYTLEFKIKWISELEDDGKLSIEKSKILDDINYLPHARPQWVYAGSDAKLSGATIAGQGTVSVISPYAVAAGGANVSRLEPDLVTLLDPKPDNEDKGS